VENERKINIFYADDTQILRKMGQRFLEGYNKELGLDINVLVFPDGKPLVDYLIENIKSIESDLNIVILDGHMKELHGIDVVNTIIREKINCIDLDNIFFLTAEEEEAIKPEIPKEVHIIEKKDWHELIVEIKGKIIKIITMNWD